MILEVPKGGYVPAFSSRRANVEALPAPSRVAGSRSMLLVASGVAAVAFLVGLWAGANWLARPTYATAGGSEAVNVLWRPILNGGWPAIIAYTNGVYFATETGDLLRYRSGAVADRGAAVSKEDSRSGAFNPKLAAEAGALYYEDDFTGVGEVAALHDLTRTFSSLGLSSVVKRARMVTVDDMRNHDVIFLGSAFNTQSLADTHFTTRFRFEPPPAPPYLWRSRITDARPGSGAPFYEIERDPRTGVIRADYAAFFVLPGLLPARHVVIMKGLTTSGTEGAVEFATSDAGIRRILEEIGIRDGARRVLPPYFECLLRVELARGLDVVDVKYVTGSAINTHE